MKRIYFSLLLFLGVFVLSTNVYGQEPCITWLSPSPTSGYVNFNNNFGGAPCDDGTGCPFNEISTFEVWASEAYAVDNFVTGGTYAFSICNGPNAGTWIPEFTIIAPSGEVDAFGVGDGDSCTITWTASESGTYMIIINEADNCGGGDNTGTSNGFPALTCTSSEEVMCEPVDSTCVAGILITTDSLWLCSADTFNINVTGDTIPSGGGFGYVFSPGEDGTGALGETFILSGASEMATYDNDLGGILSNNDFPPFAGTWSVRGAVYTTPGAGAFNSICSMTEDSLVITFSDISLSLINNDDGSATANVTGGTMPYTYLWSDGQTTETATNLTSGMISVTVTEAAGCTATDSILIGEMAEPCTTWLAPAPPGAYINFNTVFGGAPCDSGDGCPFNEISTFEVWASEAYTVDNFVAGGSYAFSICNGTGAGTWIPEFTIIAPSGAVDAFGLGDGDSCTISWTASESGTYVIVINEAGFCGAGSDNVEVDNGFPALTCTSSDEVMCEPMDSTCIAGMLTTTGAISVCDSASFDVMVINDSIPVGGGFGYVFDPALGGVGGLDDVFILSNSSQTTTFNNDLNGVLSANDFPLMEGTWVIRGAVYSDSDDTFGSICDFTADSLIVTFGQSPTVQSIVDNGDGSATVTVTGGAQPYTYLWADGQTTATAMGLPAGMINVQITEANGCSVTAELDIMVGLNEIKELEALNIFPNPTSDKFFVEIELNTQEVINMELYDFTGRRINHFVSEATTLNTFEFNMAAYPAGIYVLHIQVGKGSISRKIVVE